MRRVTDAQKAGRPSGIPTCPVTRKQTFESRRRARAHLKTHRDLDGFRCLAVYRCRHCGLWHLTSQPS